MRKKNVLYPVRITFYSRISEKMETLPLPADDLHYQ